MIILRSLAECWVPWRLLHKHHVLPCQQRHQLLLSPLINFSKQLRMNTTTTISSKRHWYSSLISESIVRSHMLLTAHSESFGCSWSLTKLFPWKPLPKKLAESSVVVWGWSDGVLSLGEEYSMNSSSKPTHFKGISNLTLSEAGKIMSAFQDMGPNCLCFEYHPKWRGMLVHLYY